MSCGAAFTAVTEMDQAHLAQLEDLFRRVALEAIAPVQQDMAELRRFVDRRMAEVGAEIAASVEFMDMGEQAIHRSLQEVRDQIAAIAHLKSGMSSANTGYELEAILQLTETAAERILNAAERIGARLSARLDGPGGEALRQISVDLAPEIEAIFEACAFQDLTGQRVRRAVEHLGRVEQTLNGTLQKLGLGEPAAVPEAPVVGPGISQDDIDRLFG